MGDILQVSPTELKFKFELRKNIPVILTLTNPTSDKVAFKVKTTSPKTYCVRPSSGLVEPNSTMQVQIIRQAQREAPPAYGETKDKFLVQSTKLGADVSDLAPELFDSNKNVGLQQSKLRVALVGPPQPPSPVPEHPETGEEEFNAAQPVFESNRGIEKTVDRDATAPTTDVVAHLRDKADKAEKENAELRKKLVARGGTSTETKGGLSILHLVLVALIAFWIGYFLK